MNASRPEADTEYSRGPGVSKGVFGRHRRAPEDRWQRRFELHRNAVLATGLLGAVLLVLAEFTPLLHVHTTAHIDVRTVYTGAHNSYALIPVAIVAAILAFSTWSSGSRLALLAIGALGLLTLGIALLGDLPDAHTSGLVRTASGLEGASSSVGLGLYLETLGAVVLIITAAGGMLLEPIATAPRPPDARSSSSRTRSAS
ncbi:MAG: hypothetical protein WAK93_06075 [Solirubrobacteraceae bacterium]